MALEEMLSNANYFPETENIKIKECSKLTWKGVIQYETITIRKDTTWKMVKNCDTVFSYNIVNKFSDNVILNSSIWNSFFDLLASHWFVICCFES